MSSTSRVWVTGRGRVFRLLWLGLLLLELTACSAVKVAYNNVDVYLLWKAQRYFALDSGQKARLRTELDSTSVWHRSEELARYASAIEALRECVGSGISETDIEWLMTSARLRYEALARHAAPGAAAVLSSLTPAQIAHFEAKLRRENDEFAAEFVDPSPEVQRRERFQRTLDLMEAWVGPLSETQRTRMERLSFELPLTGALRHADRQRRQQALIALLEQHRTPEALAPGLEAWMIEWDQGRAPEYQALAGETRRQTVAMVVALDRSLSPAQRVRLQERLTRYAGEFESLALTPPVHMAALDLSAL